MPADPSVMMSSALAIGVGEDADHWRLDDGPDEDHRSQSIGGIRPQLQTDQPQRGRSARSMPRPVDRHRTTETVPVLIDIGFGRLDGLISLRRSSHVETSLKRLTVGFRMPRPLQFSETAPFAVRDGAIRLGERLALARKRRRLTPREIAAKAGISYDTARAAEAGNLQTGLGAYLAMLWAMGLESEINSFLDPDRDETGKQLEIARQPRRVAHRRTKHDDGF